MIRSLGRCFLFFIFCLLFSCAINKQKLLVQHENMVRSAFVANVSVDDRCAGVRIGTEYIITAAHCVDHCQRVGLIPFSFAGHSYSGRLASCDPGTDVAVIRSVLRLDRSPVSVSNHVPYLGEDLLIIGNPASLPDGTVSHGTFSGSYGSYYIIDGTAWFGNSGGGIYNSDGELVGITSKMVSLPNPFSSFPTGIWFLSAGLSSIVIALGEADGR